VSRRYLGSWTLPSGNAFPWPDALPGLGPRCVIAFSTCQDCTDAGGQTLYADAPDGKRYAVASHWAPGTWASYSGWPLCQACAQAREFIGAALGDHVRVVIRLDADAP
jgi:hypothetical protein